MSRCKQCDEVLEAQDLDPLGILDEIDKEVCLLCRTEGYDHFDEDWLRYGYYNFEKDNDDGY